MAFIQNLFTSRDNSANAATYVGQQGRIWWDPLTNSMYYSDGSTPGGIPIGAGGNPFDQILNTNSNVHTPVLHPSICHLALSLPYLRDLYFALSSVASVAVLECKDADKVSIS